MKFTKKRFNVAVGSGAVTQAHWDRIFRKPPLIEIRTFNCDSNAHNSCPRTLGMDWAHCDCQCHELSATP